MYFTLLYNKILTSKTVIIECISWLINVTDLKVFFFNGAVLLYIVHSAVT